jgi:hypothetical protein
MKSFLLISGISSLLSLGLLPGSTPAARAQDGVMGDMTGWVAYSNVLTADSEGKSKTATARRVSSAYTPTPALRQATVRTYTEQLRKTNPAAAQALAQGLASGPNAYERRYQSIIQDTGLHDNDAADALASYLILGWMIANDVRDDKAVTVPMAQGVRAQAARQLGANPKLGSATALAQLGEELKLQTVVLHLGLEEALRSNQMDTYQQAIAGRFKREYGLDLTALRLSSQGFGKK